MNNKKRASLPMMALSEVPEAKSDAEKIVSLIKSNGRIVGYKLSGGQELSKSDAVELARNGGIKGVGIAKRNGGYYLKSLPDSEENNNLGNLPSLIKTS